MCVCVVRVLLSTWFCLWVGGATPARPPVPGPWVRGADFKSDESRVVFNFFFLFLSCFLFDLQSVCCCLYLAAIAQVSLVKLGHPVLCLFLFFFFKFFLILESCQWKWAFEGRRERERENLALSHLHNNVTKRRRRRWICSCLCAVIYVKVGYRAQGIARPVHGESSEPGSHSHSSNSSYVSKLGLH